MGLRDKYTTPLATTPATSVLEPASGSSPDPASELAALRAKLAGRGNVNPPEAMIPDDAMTRTTRETADGGAELIAQADAAMNEVFIAALDAAQYPVAGASAASTDTPGKKSRTRKPPAAAEAPSAAGVEALLERIANALELIGDNLRLRNP